MPFDLPAETEQVEPKNLTEAIARIMGEIGGIGKTHKADERQGGYRYRGIEDITERLQELLSTYGVVLYPQVEDITVREIEVNGKPWTDTTLKVKYVVKHGASGTQMVVCTYGIGRDNSDKGANKALTQAFKYALLQMFCISDPKDDNDGTHDVADRRGQQGSGRGNSQSASTPRAGRAPSERSSSSGGGELAPSPSMTVDNDPATLTKRALQQALAKAGLNAAGTEEVLRARWAEHLGHVPAEKPAGPFDGDLACTECGVISPDVHPCRMKNGTEAPYCPDHEPF